MAAEESRTDTQTLGVRSVPSPGLIAGPTPRSTLRVHADAYATAHHCPHAKKCVDALYRTRSANRNPKMTAANLKVILTG